MSVLNWSFQSCLKVAEIIFLGWAVGVGGRVRGWLGLEERGGGCLIK